MPNSVPGFRISTDKKIAPEELADLFSSVGWGDETDCCPDLFVRSIVAYPLVAHCRDDKGLLIGYVSAFTDGAFTAFVGELVVRPEYQRMGIGSALISIVVERSRGVPIYGMTFDDTREFFLRNGFSTPKRAVSVLSMRNA